MSSFDDLLEALQERLGVTVEVSGGKRELSKHKAQRQVILVRQRGIVAFRAPAGALSIGIPIGGTGPDANGAPFTQAVQQATETIELTCRGRDTDDTELVFHNTLGHLFFIGAPNIFDEQTPYEWINGDAAGGPYTARNPAIKAYFVVRLKVQPVGPLGELAFPLEAADGELFYAEEAGATAPADGAETVESDIPRPAPP